MKNLNKFGMALALASFVATVQAAPVAYQAAAVNDNWGAAGGTVVLKNGSDELCWRNNVWTPATANPQCDSALAKVEKPAVTKQSFSGTFSLGADAAFGLGSSVVTPKGKATLDQTIAKLNAYNIETVNVKGYADSQGQAAANQVLSEKRAAAVKNYLASRGIDANKIKATGFGASNYVVDPAACRVARVNGRPVSRTVCEAANRRVDIDFRGTAK